MTYFADVPSRAHAGGKSGVKQDIGLYEGLVVENADSTLAGRVSVWISDFGGDPKDPTSWYTVRYASPFYGLTDNAAYKQITGAITAGEFRRNESNPLTAGYLDNRSRAQAPRSFGMWIQPPAIGTKVLVMFANGDAQRGFWFAAIPETAHGMIPALGAGSSGQPESEFDPSSPDVQTAADLTQVPREPLQDEIGKFSAQGLQDDPLRGFITTSSFRESPCKVMGFSTPIGHSFAMDDGGKDGKSKLIRIRTAGGNQITMHDDTGFVYVINAAGNGWIELSPDGNIDVYGQAGVNLASEGDINIHANKDVNIHAGNNLKVIAGVGTKIQGTAELQLHGSKTMIEGVDSIHMHSCNEIIITSFSDIFIKGFRYLIAQAKCFRWNSGTAKEAEQVPPEEPSTVSGYDTTVKRAPSHEPYDRQTSAPPMSQEQVAAENAAIQTNNAAERASNFVGGGGPNPNNKAAAQTPKTSVGGER